MKAFDFMTGAGSSLPDIEEIQGYEQAWLELDLPASGRVTLVRALSGGAYGIYEGTKEPGADVVEPNGTLGADHRSKGENISSFLLAELGIVDRKVARTPIGDKSPLTFRHFAPYIFTEETNMMAG